jgi:hypothetical protein
MTQGLNRPNTPRSTAPTVQFTTGAQQVLPEQMSLIAHQHIQNYLRTYHKNRLDKNDLNSILRLSSHLRVFGLLSAVGYVNQSNAQAGEVRERIVPVWESLLGQMLDETNTLQRHEIMANVIAMTTNQPKQYMATWRRALMLANHWNFWARAYQEENN